MKDDRRLTDPSTPWEVRIRHAVRHGQHHVARELLRERYFDTDPMPGEPWWEALFDAEVPLILHGMDLSEGTRGQFAAHRGAASMVDLVIDRVLSSVPTAWLTALTACRVRGLHQFEDHVLAAAIAAVGDSAESSEVRETARMAVLAACQPSGRRAVVEVVDHVKVLLDREGWPAFSVESWCARRLRAALL